MKSLKTPTAVKRHYNKDGAALCGQVGAEKFVKSIDFVSCRKCYMMILSGKYPEAISDYINKVYGVTPRRK